MLSRAEESIHECVNAIQEFEESCAIDVQRVADLMIKTFRLRKKVLICGNGGSAADAQHFAGELLASFGLGLQRRSLPVIALSTNSSVLTAIANDFTFEIVFARQVEGLGENGDLLIAISTSGASQNCLNAVATAKKKGMKTAALTKLTSKLYHEVDVAVGVPSQSTPHIQACHVIAFHVISELIDVAFSGTN